MKRLPVRFWHQLNRRLDAFFAWSDGAAAGLRRQVVACLFPNSARQRRRPFQPYVELLEARRVFSTGAQGWALAAPSGSPIIEPSVVAIGPFQIQPQSGVIRLAVPGSSYNLPFGENQPIIEAAFTTTALPSSIDVALTWNNGTAQTAVNFLTTGHGATDTYLLAVQVASPVTVTGRYHWSMTATFNGSAQANQTHDGYINEVGSDIASPDQLVAVAGGGGATAGELRVYDSGSSRFFPASGGGFTSPSDDFGTLTTITGGFLYTAKDEVKSYYNSAGLLTGVVDTHGQWTTYSYTGGLLTETDYPGGTKTTMGYDGSNHLQSITAPGNEITTMTTDSGTGLVSSIENSDLGFLTFSYGFSSVNLKWGALNATVTLDSNSGLPISIDEGLGSVWTIQTALGEGLATSPAVNGSSQGVAVITDPLSNATTYTLDSLGREIKLQTPDGATQQWQRNAAGLVTVSVDGLGNSTALLYDALGNVTQISNADGTTEEYQYDSYFNHQTVFENELGYKTTSTYDDVYSTSTGNLLTVKDPLNQVTTYTWTSAGLLSTVTDPLHNTTSYQYDAYQRLSVTIDPLGNHTSMLYDAAGNVTSVKDALTNVTTYKYDGMNRVTAVYDPANPSLTQEAYTYNALGAITTKTDELGRVASYVYDQRGWLTSETDAVGTAAVRTTNYYHDLAGNLTGVMDPDTNLTAFAYDAVGRATGSYDSVGNPPVQTYYDAAGNITQVTDANGHSSTFAYDVMNRLTSTTDALGNETDTLFDAAGNVTQVTDANGTLAQTVFQDAMANSTQIPSDHVSGGFVQYAYDADNRVVTIDHLGYTVSVVYDGMGNATPVVSGLFEDLTTLAYDGVGNVTQVTDGNGNSTQYVYDGDNRPTVTINPQSNRTTTLYDKVGNVTQVTDSHNHATTFSYDADHRLTVSVDPLGNRTTTLYDKVGNVTQVTDANTYATTFSYDADNRLTVTTNALGGRTTTLYDAVGNVTEVDQAYSHSTTYLYDADNRVTVTTDGAGNQTMTFYDAVGNVTEVTDPRTYSTQFLYDADNHLTVTIDPLGGRTTTGFDSFGNIVSVTDPLNHSSGYTYDLLNREIGTSDSGGNSTNLLLDAVGNVTQVTDAVGNVTQFTYDSLNHVTEATDALSHNTTYSTYDTQGQLQATTDRDGNVHGFGYDADNRLNAETGEVVIGTTTYYTLLTYTYDADGDLLTAANPNGTYTFTYDHLDRVSTVREPFGVTLTFTYDLVGNRTGVQDSLGDVTTSLYDADNRLTSTQYSGPGVGGAGTTTLRIDLTYNADSEIATETRYSNLAGTTVVGTATYDYDHADRLTTLIQDNGSGTVLASNTYSYDAAGRLTVEHDNGIPMTYTYDDANQVQADGVHTYTYDGTGNRTNTGYTTNADNELTSDGTWSYNYDDQGNLIGKVAGSISWDYGYDFLNHMVSAKEFTGATLTNEVDYKYLCTRQPQTVKNLRNSQPWLALAA